MKTTINHLFLLLLALSFTACNDWLDVEPSTEMDRGDLFKDEAGFADALSGVYAEMTSDELYGKTMTWHMLTLMGGGAKTTYGDNASLQSFAFHPKAETYMGYYSEDYRTSFVDPIWNKMYNVIANLNSILESIDGKQGVFAGHDYEVMKGEALGLRAFLHFELLRLFADAPSSADYAETNTYIPYVSSLTSEVHPLLTVKQCAVLIADDLKQAKELLRYDPMFTDEAPSEYVCSAVTGSASNRTRYGVKDWHNRRFHFNYYAAVGTLARLHLWMGEQSEALSCAKEVIDAQPAVFPWVNPTLVSNVMSTSEYVPRDRTFSTEQLFALHITDMPDRMDGYMCENEISYTSMNGALLGFDDSCFDAATRSSDPRFAYLKTTYSYYGNEFFISTKYYKDNDYQNSNSPWSANRVPLMRVSEMYYIAAECEPDLDAATEYLEQVRRNRGMSAYPLSCADKEALQQEIEKEYLKELVAEGQTFYYYKRMNKSISNRGMYSSTVVEPALFTMPRPDDEDTYGGRTE